MEVISELILGKADPGLREPEIAFDFTQAAENAALIESLGYDGIMATETKDDPFLMLTLAANATKSLGLSTAVAIAFALVGAYFLSIRFTQGLGAVTNMSDGYPWGIWITYDVVVGTALGLAGAAVTLWVTFVPCFLWIFAGAPYIEWICAQSRLSGALNGITAAVVGVILNLSIWFALHVLFVKVEALKHGPLVLWTPDLFTADWRVIVLAAICAFLLFKQHWGITGILAVSSGVGAVFSLAF